MKIAAAYIRVSTDDQLEYSPDSQIKVILQYAKQNDYEIPSDFIFREEEGRSGRKAEKRPEFLRMIATAKQKPAPFEAILCWKFSRFARNQEESIVYKSMLRKDGVDVISVSEPLADGPFGGLIERIIEWMDEYYSIRLSGDVKRGMTECVSRGNPVSVPPFGYRLVNKQLVPDSDEAAIVGKIFDDFAAGVPSKSIAVQLNSLGVKSHRGNEMENRTIDYIINNPVYLGKIRWTPTGRTMRNYHNPDTMVTDGNHSPIITQLQWDAAQAKSAEYKQIYRKYYKPAQNKNALMLSGIARCSSCGGALISGGSTNSYQCCRYAHGQCTVSHAIRYNKLDIAVIDEIERDSCIDLSRLHIECRKSSPLPNIEHGRVVEQIKKNEIKLQRCKEAYQDGIDTIDEYRKNKAELQNTILTLKASLDVQEPAPIDPQKFHNILLQAVPTLRSENVSNQSKNTLLRSFVDHIVFDRENSSIQIYYYF